MKKNISAGLRNWKQNSLKMKTFMSTGIALRTQYILVVFMMFSLFNVHADSSGKNLFNQNCMICHADDGSGAMPGVSDLTENRNWSTLTNMQLLGRLNQGIQKPGAAMNMPPKGGNPNLTDKDLLLIISYMRKEFLK